MRINTTYNDLTGKISADFADDKRPGELDKFCEENNIDLEKFSPIGIELDCGENSSDNYGPIKVSVYVIENEIWSRDFKTIGEYLQKSEKPKIQMIYTKVNFASFFKKYLKRFRAMILYSWIENLVDIDEDEIESINEY